MGLLEVLSLAIRGLQFLFAIIVLGLTGHIASYGFTPSQDSFLIFVAIWTILIVLYQALTPRFLSSTPATHPAIHFGLDALTMLFWFSGFIAMAVLDRALHNTEIDVIVDYYDFYGNGCNWTGNWCSQITAAVVFGAFEWALFAITTLLSAFQAFRGGSNKPAATTGPPVA